jgi:membrane protease YdiL (CAAX protease family)
MYLPAGLVSWLSFALWQPLIEEVVFRGILQGQALRLWTRNGEPRRLGPITLANLLVTLAFVALHLRVQPLAWALAVSVPSLVFGHLRERMSSVWPAVLVHSIYNTAFAVTACLVQA